MIIKICGIRTSETALAAAGSGADILGFVFAPSRRQVDVATVQEINRVLLERGLTVKTAGVFVNASLEEVREIAATCALDYVQLHGEETPEFCAMVGRPVIKAFRVSGPESFKIAERYSTEWLLFDTFSAGSYGGTGESFDWSLLENGQKQLLRPYILAGGLTPENVAAAIQLLRPSGVDVSGGVETDGVKDPGKIIGFIRAARAATGGFTDA